MTDLPQVSLPGRMSVHDRDGQTWVVDSAVSPAAVGSALDWCRTALGEPSTILLSIPDRNDIQACHRMAGHPAVQPVRADVPHLTFPPGEQGGQLPTLAALDVSSLGPLVLAVGTLSFVGDVLELLDVDMTRLF